MTPDDRVAWMRRLGVVQASWTGEDLTSCLLGPEPTPDAGELPAKTKADEQAEADELLFGAS